MAKSTGKGKSLVIVESPAKARTISKYLGADYIVEASIGHVRDLPAGKKEVPEKFKAEPWAYLGVNTEDNFEPLYIVPDDKKKQVKKLKDALKTARVKRSAGTCASCWPPKCPFIVWCFTRLPRKRSKMR